MSDDKPALVIGRVVSMEHGRPTISVPVGREPLKPEVVKLIAAARRYRDLQDFETRDALLEAAKGLKE